MSLTSPERSASLRLAIERFLLERLDTKLKPLPPDDSKRPALLAQFVFTVWIDDAARRASQIQAVTHALKGTHPDARGTSLYRPPSDLVQHAMVGSHCLADDFAGDVVGNAAALDVYKFLRITHEGRTLLDRMLVGDPDMLAALSDDVAQAQAWVEAFTGIARPRGKYTSHTRAKQLYWLVGDDPDPRENANYHLLAPLYASSLAHAVFATIKEDRFGDPAKAARQARRAGDFSDAEVHEYPHLAVQMLGGTKPQNISQLNSERKGNNYLLASLPPLWESSDLRPPRHIENAMHAFGRRREVRRLVRNLAEFLKADPGKTVDARNSRDECTDQIIEELLQYASSLQQHLPGGWSAADDCKLLEHQRLWLDPYREVNDVAFASQRRTMEWVEDVYKDFAHWLNDRLAKATGLPMGSPEDLHWAKELQDAMKGGLLVDV